MLQERLNNLAVNWFDGMSINKEHFIAQENHLKELCIDAVGQKIQSYNYGLLPLPNGGEQLFHIDIDSRKVLHVKIQTLRAVTLGGARIEITPSSGSAVELKQELGKLVPGDQESREFALVLTVNPFGREPFGNADPEENPPRKPHVLPVYALNLVPMSELSQTEAGLFHITVGRLSLEHGGFQVSKNYIPPCTAIESAPRLLDYLGKMQALLLQLEECVIRIVQKVRSKQQGNTLALTINYLSENILQFLSNQLPAFSLYLKQQPPVYTLEKIIMLARVTHNSIETWQGNGKEELLNYFTEWCDLNQGMLEKNISALSNLKYNHQDADASFEKANDFLKVLVSLFQVLSELDYIGKKVDTNLFVAEEESSRDHEDRKVGIKSWFRK